MKKLVYVLLFLAILGIVIVACKKNREKINREKSPVVSSVNLKSGIDGENIGFQFPLGTSFTENVNSDGEIMSYDFTLPSNSKMFGITSNNDITYGLAGGTGTLTCTCSGKGGCKPFTAAGKWGCLMDGCTDCKGTVKATKTANETLNLFFVVRGEASEFLYLSSLGNGSPILSIEDWLTLPFIESSDFDNSVFQNVFTELSEYISSESRNSNNMVSIPYSIEGKKMLIDIPFELVEDGMLYTIQAGSSVSSISCSGSCKNGNCVKKTAAMGQVTYCDGCQSGCSLSM
jgi:hypothetical protein